MSNVVWMSDFLREKRLARHLHGIRTQEAAAVTALYGGESRDVSRSTPCAWVGVAPLLLAEHMIDRDGGAA